MELWRPHLKKNLNITASTKQRQIISNYAVAGFFFGILMLVFIPMGNSGRGRRQETEV